MTGRRESTLPTLDTHHGDSRRTLTLEGIGRSCGEWRNVADMLGMAGIDAPAADVIATENVELLGDGVFLNLLPRSRAPADSAAGPVRGQLHVALARVSPSLVVFHHHRSYLVCKRLLAKLREQRKPCAQIIASASGITGFTLPGMMLLPGCSAGN